MACDFAALGTIDPNDPEQANALLQQCLATATDPTLWFWATAFSIVGALGGALLGKYRNGNAIGRDAMLGLALGPFGWLVSLYLGPRRMPRTCTACALAAQPGDLHCRRCGAKLPA